MKIATFNVNSITARLPALLRWLGESRPDIACLQELKVPQERFPEAAIRDAGYGAVWHGQKSWNGVAILARLRIDHLLLSPSLAGRLTAAEVDRDVRAGERASDHAPVWITLADQAVGGELDPATASGGRTR